MRSFRLLLAFAVLSAMFTLTVGSTSAAAQQAQSCTGNINIVRVSEVKPGMMSKFMDAVAAQQAWYKSKGTADKIEVMRVMVQDAATKKWSYSDTQTITTHVESTAGKAPDHDAGYDAFVALFSDSSTIKSSYVTCVVTK